MQTINMSNKFYSNSPIDFSSKAKRLLNIFKFITYFIKSRDLLSLVILEYLKLKEIISFRTKTFYYEKLDSSFAFRTPDLPLLSAFQE